LAIEVALNALDKAHTPDEQHPDGDITDPN